MSDHIILPSIPLESLTIADPPARASELALGYNPAVGPAGNLISDETAALILAKRTTLGAHSIYERNIGKKSPEISLSSLSFLFCEIVSWVQAQSKGVQDLEARLNGLGYQVGQRYLELVKLREGIKHGKREVRVIEMLQFVHGPFWRALFGKVANELEKSQDVDNEYMISDNVPLLAKFISVPRDYGDLNVSAFVAGVIEGALDQASFAAEVSAHSVPREGAPLRTTFLIKFDPSVLQRERIRFR
ncbi:Trafficking protein particle complex subunit [[Candida] zeylanoides]